MNKAPTTLFDRLKYIGPSAIVTGSVVGSGSIVMTPLLGAAAGSGAARAPEEGVLTLGLSIQP